MTRWRRAMVTGASAGIGEHIARLLAETGTDLVVVARREARLEKLRDELSGVEVEIMVADLASADDLARVVRRLGDTDAPIDLLVNNAGAGRFGRVWERPVIEATAQIELNVTALVTLSHAAAMHMVAAARGTILNISSVAGNQPGPGNAVYGASKAFVTSFTEALAMELRGTGVSATAACPGLTHTEFHDVAGLGDASNGPGFLWMDAASVARDSIAAASRGRVVRVNGLGNRVLAIGSQVAPRAVKRAVAGRIVARLRPK